MGVLRLILGDQLSLEISSLQGADRSADLILMAEVQDEATYVRHHKKKIAFVFSAMRHFAAELEAAGYRVRYVRLTDPDNAGNLRGEVARALEGKRADRAGCVPVQLPLLGLHRPQRTDIARQSAYGPDLQGV
ncbi:MAG: cryptochrome/photolyase family protein [Hyphomonas sp.]